MILGGGKSGIGTTVIQYEGSICRPPSEARSLILQATLGCSHNQCAFCVAYQEKPFRARPQAELFEELDSVLKDPNASGLRPAAFRRL